MSLNRTKIEWVKNPDGTQGYTCNITTGCLNHDNGLCKGGGFPCYAYGLAHGRLKGLYLANDNISQERIWVNGEANKDGTALTLVDPFYPRFWVSRLEQADEEMKKAKKPMGMFFNDMSDWVGIGVPESWTDWTIELARRNPRHRIYTLTKQPQNLAMFSPFPDNCWVGATCTSKRAINHALPYLMKVGARLVYLSIEPFLEWDDSSAPITADRLSDAGIGWIIIGAQTKPTKYPKVKWVEELVGVAKEARIPYFLKNNLEPILPDDKLYWKLGYENGQFTDAKPRQEMPK